MAPLQRPEGVPCQRREQCSDGHGPEPAASSGQVLNGSSLFMGNDADGDSLLYFFFENSPAATSGHFEINGVTQAAGTTFAVSQAQQANRTLSLEPWTTTCS